MSRITDLAVITVMARRNAESGRGNRIPRARQARRKNWLSRKNPRTGKK